jgi:hypothetical protein
MGGDAWNRGRRDDKLVAETIPGGFIQLPPN